MKKKIVVSALALCALPLLGACSNVGQVKPWEKGNLAKPEMTFAGDRLDEHFNEHIYVSKEAAAGGSSAGTGGCGCN